MAGGQEYGVAEAIIAQQVLVEEQDARVRQVPVQQMYRASGQSLDAQSNGHNNQTAQSCVLDHESPEAEQCRLNCQWKQSIAGHTRAATHQTVTTRTVSSILLALLLLLSVAMGTSAYCALMSGEEAGDDASACAPLPASAAPVLRLARKD